MTQRGMRVACALLLLAAACAARQAPELDSWLKADSQEEGDIWAVLIAGSAGWGNYRHQADVSHAYQMLRRGGVKPDNIITMMYDDIAHNQQNPHPGKIFNRPNGENVYVDIPIDYRGPRVNAKNFLAVLAGNETATDTGRGKVLANTPRDRVFVYFSDHGAPGVLGMPAGPFLYADQLNDVIRHRSRVHGFKEMVVYIEACESGSLFEGVLEEDLDVYATTAANGRESSWGTYCPGMNPAPPPEFNTCLGDLYSVAFLENSDHADLTKQTLKKQYQLVKARTSNNFTYTQGSHVMRFGTLDIDQEPVANFMGQENTGDGTLESAANSNAAAGASWTPLEAVPQRDADLLPLWVSFTRATEGAAKSAALRALDAEVARRAALDRSMHAAVESLLLGTNALGGLQAKYGSALGVEMGNTAGIVSLLVTGHLLREEGTPLVQDWECLRGMVAAWEGACGQMDQYAMQYTRTFANLCNAGAHPDSLAATARGACAVQSTLIMPLAQVAAS